MIFIYSLSEMKQINANFLFFTKNEVRKYVENDEFSDGA